MPNSPARRPITRLLIANRGEIAVRIIETAKKMSIATIAVYSEADKNALHVKLADEAFPVGEAPAAKSYLRGDVLIEAALKAGCDAIHPGYGFLSENAEFAQACTDSGLIFVGPSAEAIAAMGDKARAKALMLQAGVPVVPGYDGSDQSDHAFIQEAGKIGAPVLLKAVAGGGGRGMRRVDNLDDLPEALVSARREAENTFGNGDLILEKLVIAGRHIEFQIFADNQGNCIHLGERDCSFQRRHQKIIEESPSPFLDDELRSNMGAAAIRAAKATDYYGAGTIEFIVDESGDFYFLEMNTRLQVEHPVTEMVTGLDLVVWQLQIASGAPLPLSQNQLHFNGHAIEARLYTEDPTRDFAPQLGKVLFWNPESTPQTGTRIDSGITEGDSITPWYDPMVAKFIAHGKNRDEARTKLVQMLEGTPLLGVINNAGFLRQLIKSGEFATGRVTTGLIDQWIEQDVEIFEQTACSDTQWALAACLFNHVPQGNWFRSSGLARYPLSLICRDHQSEVVCQYERGVLSSVETGGENLAVVDFNVETNKVSARINGQQTSSSFAFEGNQLWLAGENGTFVFVEQDYLAEKPRAADPSKIVSPVSGLLRESSVAVGDRVQKDQVVAIVEAMKMETKLVAGMSGRIGSIHGQEGHQVQAGAVVVEIEEAD